MPSNEAMKAAEKLEAESYEWLELTIHGDAYAEQAFDVEKIATIIDTEFAAEREAVRDAIEAAKEMCNAVCDADEIDQGTYYELRREHWECIDIAWTTLRAALDKVKGGGK